MKEVVAVLAGGPSSERQVSLWTSQTITDSLARLDVPYQVIDPRSSDWLSHLRALAPSLVVIALHGTFGEDGTVQHILETENIPFTGSSAEVAKLAFDKTAAKQIVRSLGFAAPESQEATEGAPVTVQPPVVVKPVHEGSSYGITIVWQAQEIEPAVVVARQYDSRVMVEKYVAGTEVTCGVIDVRGKIEALPIVEIRPETEFFDFKAKYDAKFCHEICPAEIAPALTAAIQQQSIKIFTALGCRQYARIDWIISEEKPYFLEINTLPGLTANSLLNKELAAAGIDFDHFIGTLVETAKKKKL